MAIGAHSTPVAQAVGLPASSPGSGAQEHPEAAASGRNAVPHMAGQSHGPRKGGGVEEEVVL